MAFPGTDSRAARPAARRLAARAFAAALAVGLLLAACAPADSPGDAAAISVTDGAGRSVSLRAPARRVISMMPSVTEWVVAFGAADRLVARTDYDDDPAVAHLPSIGRGLTPSVEWIAARDPDLVVAWPDAPSRSLVSRLDALGIPVYAAPSETIAEALDVAADVGRLLDHAGRAEATIADVRAGLDSVRAAVADRPRPDVLFLIGLDPVTAAGPGTFLDELLNVAGGRNVLEGTGLRWPQLSVEEVLTRAPDIIIVGSTAVDPAGLLGGRPGWRDVPAVRAGRVHAVDPNDINRPGPNLDDSAAELARLIHDGGTP